MPKFRTFDVRALLERGEEPLTKIREALDTLKEGEGLAVVAPFLPSHLIEKLGSEGFHSRVERQLGGAWLTHRRCSTPGRKFHSSRFCRRGIRNAVAACLRWDEEGFGNCSNTYECVAVCPADIPGSVMAKMYREYALATLRQKAGE